MVVVLTVNKIKAVIFSIIIAVCLIVISVFATTSAVRAKVYADCTYSDGNYGSSESCDESPHTSVASDLSDTGTDRIKYVIFASMVWL